MQADYVVDPATRVIIQLLPLMIIQTVYAIITFVMARKQGKNPWAWTIFTLVPGIGMFVFLIFFLLTLLSMLDRLNALEKETLASRF
jgi:hypothetical protein